MLDHDDAVNLIRKSLQSSGSVTCGVCGAVIEGQRYIVCPSCETPHHADCWDYNEGCSVFGCATRHPLDVVLSQEDAEDLRRAVSARHAQVWRWRAVAAVLGLVLVSLAATTWLPLTGPSAPASVPLPAPVTLTPLFLGEDARDLGTTVVNSLKGSPSGLKMITINLEPEGALAVRIPLTTTPRAFEQYRCRLTLALADDHESPAEWTLAAHEVLEPWTHEGDTTPLPGHATAPLPTLAPLTWDVTDVTRRALGRGAQSADLLLIEATPTFATARALKRLYPRARATLTFLPGEE